MKPAPPQCPTPWKRRFTSVHAAARSIGARRMVAEPYRCGCGYWHPRTPHLPGVGSVERRKHARSHLAGEHLAEPHPRCARCVRSLREVGVA